MDMTNLPTPNDQTDDQIVSAAQPAAQSSVVTPSGNKEVVVAPIDAKEGLIDATGSEMELPKEVASAGVRMQPTTIPIPQPVAQMGVKPAPASVPVATTATVTLPISDDQIARGLTQSVNDSWRWLAEWCVKRLKQLHVGIQKMGNTLIRVKV